MGESNSEFNNTVQINPEQPHLRRLGLLDKARLLLYKKPIIEGRENLPPGTCVVATTHLSGYDVPEVTAEMMKSRNTGMALQSTILNFPLFRPFVHILGKENFFPISNRNSSSLDIEGLSKMRDAIIKEGKTIVIAGYNPTKDWKLSDKPGLAAVILAHETKVPLVPVALDIRSKTYPKPRRLVKNSILGKKPDARMIIGKPISFSEIPLDKLQAAVNLFSINERRTMTQEQIMEAHATLATLKLEAEEVMKALARNLPPEKRGKWG